MNSFQADLQTPNCLSSADRRVISEKHPDQMDEGEPVNHFSSVGHSHEADEAEPADGVRQHKVTGG